MESSKEIGVNLGTAIVTGGAGGLGRSFATALAAGGHDVAILDIADSSDAEAEISQHQRRCLSVHGDAADPGTVTAFAESVRRSDLAPVRVVVNNVGISPYAPFTDTDLETWHRVLRTNLDSLYLTTQAFLPDLCEHGHGRIVNLTSTIVWDAQARDMTAYATTKAAVVGFTRSLAGEVGRFGVTVNAIAPGIVLTPDIRSRVPAEKLETYRQRQAIPRIAEAQDLVSTLLYLVDERTSLVTGSILPVNGGRVIL